ncbi:unnamed protein product, partial [Iphiclides podalirius]
MFRFFISTLLIGLAAAENVNDAVETEMFAVPISPGLFNWTYQEFDEQYRFHASLKGKPELPPWLRYVYSGRHHAGFIFGTPPRGTASPVTLEIIGLNRQDYETRRVLVTLRIHPKEDMARHEVELKIDNLNVEDLLDDHRMTRLKDILRTKLWTESRRDLYATFLSSAIDLGARLPLKPSDGEGLVVRLGSAAPFSAELMRLREEVRPLSRLPSCPRDYKRTTVERLFRDAAFALDWCSFELYNTVYKDRATLRLEYLTELPNDSRATGARAVAPRSWSAPSRSALPRRAAARPLAAALAPPLLLLLLAAVALAAVLCSRYATVTDPESEYFLENIYHICIDYRKKRAHKSGKVELCIYGTGNTEQTQLADDNSNRSLGVSPSGSLARPYSPRARNLAASYSRPEPPPYPPSSLHRRRPPAPLALEESLQLLSQANIAYEPKDPLVDSADGDDDYVLVQRRPESGYGPLEPAIAGRGNLEPAIAGRAPTEPALAGPIETGAELDDIDVPELAMYGVPGI